MNYCSVAEMHWLTCLWVQTPTNVNHVIVILVVFSVIHIVHLEKY